MDRQYHQKPSIKDGQAIPPETINQRWTGNTLAKRKKTKGQTMNRGPLTIYTTVHSKLMIEQHESH
jgi:hypothetical protein